MKLTSAVSVAGTRVLSAFAFGLFSLTSFAPAPAQAQVVTVPVKPVVGSSNPASPEPPIARPTSTPCTATLLKNEAFNNYSPHRIVFAPIDSPKCTGPWAKVIFTMDFTVSAGVQFDRTASVYIGNANVFFGTTAEPGSKMSPSWHVERDVTDLSALFHSKQEGQAVVNNIVDSTYTGVIYGTAKLLFYPADLQNPAPVVPAEVVPVSGTNSPYSLNTSTDQLSTSFTAPRNTTKAYLDVIAESQQTDEQWFLCVPNNLTGELESCGNTAFRETEITIDGKPAGIAPVYPWIYTGGLDPYLWFPIPGLQTLNFKPYRVDLTPFAGVLDDGAKHTVAFSVFNADNRFDATANLLLYTDPKSSVVTGGLLENTLSAEPTPVITPNLATDSSGNVMGTVGVSSTRSFKIEGYVNTSAGRVDTAVQQNVDFNNVQTFSVGSSYVQDAVQTSTVHSKVTETTGPVVRVTNTTTSFPLTLDLFFGPNPDGTSSQTVTSNQGYSVTQTTTLNGSATSSSSVAEQVQSTDTLGISASGNLVSAKPSSSASYTSTDSTGDCFTRTLTSAKGVLLTDNTSQSCSAQKSK